MTDEGRVTPESQAAAPQAAESVCILEPILPAHLKDSAPDDPDWDAKALEALAKQLTETNDFYHPLLDAARELRDLRTHRAATNGQSLYKILSTIVAQSTSVAVRMRSAQLERSDRLISPSAISPCRATTTRDIS